MEILKTIRSDLEASSQCPLLQCPDTEFYLQTKKGTFLIKRENQLVPGINIPKPKQLNMCAIKDCIELNVTTEQFVIICPTCSEDVSVTSVDNPLIWF